MDQVVYWLKRILNIICKCISSKWVNWWNAPDWKASSSSSAISITHNPKIYKSPTDLLNFSFASCVFISAIHWDYNPTNFSLHMATKFNAINWIGTHISSGSKNKLVEFWLNFININFGRWVTWKFVKTFKVYPDRSNLISFCVYPKMEWTVAK